MTGRVTKAQIDDLAVMLTEVDEFLRSPYGHAALHAFCAARGNPKPGYDPGLLIDHVSFTLWWLLRQDAPHPHQA
jgi:hypothetical protein